MSSTTEPRFSLKELVEASGVGERSIRYYIQQGLLPPATGRGRSAFYTRQHLEQLARILHYKNQGLSLEEIREAITPASGSDRNPAETWERIVLHPDLEILVRANAPEGIQALVKDFEQRALQWLGPDSGYGDDDAYSR